MGTEQYPRSVIIVLPGRNGMEQVMVLDWCVSEAGVLTLILDDGRQQSWAPGTWVKATDVF